MSEKTVARETTLAEDAYRALRWDILSAALPAGSPLRLDALRARYGWGYSPLREALNRLEAERLVTLAPQRGFAVANLSLAEMWDALETRIHIESEALRRAVQDGDEDWEASVVASFHALATGAGKLGAVPKLEALRALEERHHRFHSALISACGSPWLMHFAERLYAATERYRFPVLGGLAGAAGERDVTAEHRAIMEAALARDAETLVRLIAEHYRRTGEILSRLYAEPQAVPALGKAQRIAS